MKKLLMILIYLFMLTSLFAETEFKLYQDMLVTENLRLRTPAYDGRKVITVLNAGSKVKVIDIGNEETVDGIKSNWVEVEVQKEATDKDGNEVKYGVVGWCFGGYLKQTTPIKHKANYGNGNGTVISEKEDDNQIVEIRKHIQTVKIGDLAKSEQRIIYSDTKKSNVIYNLQDNDEIYISEIWTVTTKKDNFHQVWLKVTANGKSGFLCFSEPYYSDYYKKTLDISLYSIPYANNKWEIIETINSSDKKWTVRKLTQTLAVFSNEDKVELRDKPGEIGTQIIAYVPSSYKNGQGQINFEIEAVTEEIDDQKESIYGKERWVRITYSGKMGWIYGGYLSAERGGPKYCIPEDYIAFSLGWYM